MKIIRSGKRKTAKARAIINEGKGNIFINKINFKNLQTFDRLRIEEVLRISEAILGKLNFDVNISVRGGGEKGQVEAARTALARCIVDFSGSKELEKAFLDYDRNMLVADVRRKEAYKPGDSKARSMRQSSKR